MNENQPSSNSLSATFFSNHLTPVNLALVAATRGVRSAGPGQAFTYTDMACGNGTALCALAECYPKASFYGFDRNAQGIEQGQELAASAGLSNVFFETADGNAGPVGNVPPSDFLVASGLYSWTTDQSRLHIKQAAREKLSDVGLFSVHYAAKPGMVQVDAVYDLVRFLSDGSQRAAPDAIQNALNIVGHLGRKNVSLFANNSPANRFLVQLGASSSEIVQKEILEFGQRSFWFGEISGELKQQNLHFVGQAQLGMNLLKLRVPVEHWDYLLSIENTEQRETVADVLTDAVMRLDLYAKPGAFSENRLSLDQISDLKVFVPPERVQPIALDQLSQSTGINLRSSVYDAILQTVGAEGATISQIVASDALQSFKQDDCWNALLVLHVLNLLEIGFHREQRVAPAASSRVVMATRLNSVLLEEYILSPYPIAFSGPSYGKPILLGMKERLVLYDILGGNVEELWERLGKQGLTVHDAQQRPVSDLGNFKSILASESELFSNTTLPLLIRMGAVTELPPEGPQ